MNQNPLTVSTLPHTWILDADGMLCVHDEHLQGEDKLPPMVKDFFASLLKEDMVVLITSRKEDYREVLKTSLQGEGTRFNHIIYGAPVGERILVNDEKPSGLRTDHAISKSHNSRVNVNFKTSQHL